MGTEETSGTADHVKSDPVNTQIYKLVSDHSYAPFQYLGAHFLFNHSTNIYWIHNMCQEPFRAEFLNIKEAVPEQVRVASAANTLVFF